MKQLITAALLLVSAQVFAAENPGTYWVPVARELSRYSVFNIDTVTVKVNNGRVRMSYALPLELTGELNYFEFEGAEPAAGQPLVVTSPHGEVVCPTMEDFSMCETNYKNLNINPRKRSEFLREISRTELEFQVRDRVAQGFCVGAVRRAFASTGPFALEPTRNLSSAFARSAFPGATHLAAAASGGEPCGFLRIRQQRAY